jgi:translation initiation factor 1A
VVYHYVVDIDSFLSVRLPKRKQNEFFPIVKKRLSGSRLTVSCGDGKARMARIPGSRKRRFKRIKDGDLLIIKPWDIQDEKADVLYHYRKNQAKFLSRIHKIPRKLDVF